MQTADGSKSISNEIREKMEQYRTELLAFEMQEPSKRESSGWHWYFFKPMTELTAFIVNLAGNDHGVELVYGYASTGFTRFPGDENALNEWGVSDEDITIREKFVVHNEVDEKTATSLIADMYNKYSQTQKDALLSYAKEKRKAFIQQISRKLKPLGFKQKANTWTRALSSEYYLMFNAQKSSFSDEYYFNVYIGKNGTNHYGDCYSTRIAPEGMCPLDWQTLHPDAFDSFLDSAAVPMFENIIHTPLSELGKIPSYWSGCLCDHQKCAHCWMEKNLWESEE